MLATLAVCHIICDKHITQHEMDGVKVMLERSFLMIRFCEWQRSRGLSEFNEFRAQKFTKKFIQDELEESLMTMKCTKFPFSSHSIGCRFYGLRALSRLFMVMSWVVWVGVIYAGTEQPRYVAVGAPFSNNQAMIVHSADGKNWQTVYNQKHSTFIRIVKGNGVYVAVTQKFGVLYSMDAKHWEESSLPAVIQNSSLSPGGLAYGDGLFVIAGSGQTILYSADGKNWSKWGETLESAQQKGKRAAEAERLKNNELNQLKKTGSNSVEVDNAKRGSSVKAPLLTTDESTASGRIHFNAVEFVNGEFFLLGNGDRIARFKADNGQLAFLSNSKPSDDLVPSTRGVAFGNDRYVVGGTQSLYVSQNATEWKSVSLGAQAWSVAFGNGAFVIVNGFGEAFNSTDGSNWQKKTLGCTRVYRQVIFTGTQFMAVGDNCVATSKDGTSWTVNKMAFDQKHMSPIIWSLISNEEK